MLHVNEDNNDELFRKAAEGFFLKTDLPDWEDLGQRMEAHVSSISQQKPVAEKKTTYKWPLSVFKWLYEKTLSNNKPAFFRFKGPAWWYRKSKKKNDLQCMLSYACTQLRGCWVFALKLNAPNKRQAFETNSKKYFYYSAPPRKSEAVPACCW